MGCIIVSKYENDGGGGSKSVSCIVVSNMMMVAVMAATVWDAPLSTSDADFKNGSIANDRGDE